MATLYIPDAVKKRLKENSFTQQRRWFLRERDGLVQCVAFERPSQIIYPTYCIIPLYMPCTVRYYTYGRRISEVSRYRDASTIDERALLDALDRTVLPLFERLKTPALLLQYLLNDPKPAAYLSCPPIDLAVLEAYTALFLGEYDRFSRAVQKALRLLEEPMPFMPDFANKLRAELETLREYAAQPADVLHRFFDEIMTNSRNTIL